MSSEERDKARETAAESKNELIEKAVKFLLDDRVSRTSLEERKEFLQKKGLNDVEINEAILKASEIRQSTSNISKLGEIHPLSLHSQNTSPGNNANLRWTNVAGIVVLAGGATYLTISFIKNYLMPKLFCSSETKDQRKVQQLQDSISEVQNGLKFLVDSVQQTFTVVQQQQELSNKLLQHLTFRDNQAVQLQRTLLDLKDEIVVVKSLLLGRDQFPPIPGNMRPTLPAWQRIKKGSEPSCTASGDFQPLVNGNDYDLKMHTNETNVMDHNLLLNNSLDDEEDDVDELNRSIPLNPNEKMTPV